MYGYTDAVVSASDPAVVNLLTDSLAVVDPDELDSTGDHKLEVL